MSRAAREYRRLRTISLLCATVIFITTASCSFPKIIVLQDPLSPEEHINLGVAYENNGEIENAVEEYKEAAKEIPIAYYYLGNVCFGKGDYPEAEKYYRKAIRKNPHLADAYNNLAWLYYTKNENLLEAEELARKAVGLNPSNENYKDTLNDIRDLLKKEEYD